MPTPAPDPLPFPLPLCRRARGALLLAALGLVAAPAAAQAAPAKIAPRATPVTATGSTSIEVANPNRHALSGRATLTVGGRAVARRKVRLPKRSVTTVSLKLDGKGLTALRSAGTQRATVGVRLARGKGRARTVRRTLSLTAPAAGPAPTPAPAPGTPAGPKPATPTPPAPSNRWVGRMGTEGAYDDLELTLADGQLQFTKAPALAVFCLETGGRPNNEWTSGELFDAPGPWTIGADGAIDKQGVSVNPLVGRSPRTITYKVTGTTQETGKISGTLGMIFYAARPDVFYGNTVIVNCWGSQSFEAIPAP